LQRAANLLSEWRAQLFQRIPASEWQLVPPQHTIQVVEKHNTRAKTVLLGRKDFSTPKTMEHLHLLKTLWTRFEETFDHAMIESTRTPQQQYDQQRMQNTVRDFLDGASEGLASLCITSSTPKLFDSSVLLIELMKKAASYSAPCLPSRSRGPGRPFQRGSKNRAKTKCFG
ncbi:unnamed protein product, partial [Amoebophrya sp. A25]